MHGGIDERIFGGPDMSAISAKNDDEIKNSVGVRTMPAGDVSQAKSGSKAHPHRTQRDISSWKITPRTSMHAYQYASA